ncbi:N-acetyl-beta-glucosaminyl-glycoprotein 4-beta-N-acetylgalactosaminyltransferase 1 isoform X2 [Heterocephalus glaber]|uniref:N-acetyl-beta-glucosaminyl-glycoprotein 4-beta-N-acetylgalactosaminyltransferase 1 isoform X2 n=1 Tax=Heterocephalus glaber TaxID=10181 RepID=A0AAX6R130_HETGA|nr:N-acetyl-beta-glucosaminyl-glycoprotein 4-beta-N-acetylgalactosaminyltransferase 1 isoform X2 [Heterocephalus glaber]
MPWFPVKKVRKRMKLLLLLLLLTCAAWLTYVHLSLARQGRAMRQRPGHARDGEKLADVTDGRGIQGAPSTQRAEDSSESREEEQAFKGQVNLHVFEDWCGGAVGHLRRNLHFPLFPHTRTTVRKLAVSPRWRNYGLRIFGYIHPARDGDVQFSVASDDNSEFWLSLDESPAAAQLVAFVGKTGSEWTAPGEFTKFSSQVSKPKRLMASRRYYFELLHKQDDRGSDHVEVGWRTYLPGLKFEVISAAHISLYTDESSLKMDHVAHVPQSPASHVRGHLPKEESSADMLRPDPRDSFFLTPRIEPWSLESVLEPCAYAPTYVLKDFPIARYQGLQFVYLSFVYPNDYTRLTHMETENKCFYRESPRYLERFGFYKYMKMDKQEGEDGEEEQQRRAFLFLSPEDFLDEEDEGELLDSLEPTEVGPPRSGRRPPTPPLAEREPELSASHGPQSRHSRALRWAMRPLSLFLGHAPPPRAAEKPPAKVYVTRVRPRPRVSPRGPAWPPLAGVLLRARAVPRAQLRAPRPRRRSRGPPGTEPPAPSTLGAPQAHAPTPDVNSSAAAQPMTSFLSLSQVSRPQLLAEGEGEEEDRAPGDEVASEDSEEDAAGRVPGHWREDAIDWQRTFSVGAVDFELLRSDWNDLRCNVSGNLQLPEAEAVDVAAQYMERLNARHGGRFTLLRIVNVEKRRDSARGSRFLLELELQERGGGRLRLSEFVFLRVPGAHARGEEGGSPEPPPAASTRPDSRPELCRPLRLAWRQDVAVHFIVPVSGGHGLTARAHGRLALQRHPGGLRERRHGRGARPAPGTAARVSVPETDGELRALCWAAGRSGCCAGPQQHRLPLRPAHPLPTQHPGQHPQALRGGHAGLRPRGHAPGLWEFPSQPAGLLGSERLWSLRDLQVRLRPRGRHEHGGVPRPVGRRGLGAPGQGPAGGAGGGATPTAELLPLLPLQAGHVGHTQPQGDPRGAGLRPGSTATTRASPSGLARRPPRRPPSQPGCQAASVLTLRDDFCEIFSSDDIVSRISKSSVCSVFIQIEMKYFF